MVKTLDTEKIDSFDLSKADAFNIRESEKTDYSSKSESEGSYNISESTGSLENYSCDAGCKNCHCAGF
jgi:hypothetical protein|tara:strand:- start:1943 stop:2146 length:204 start_codon:yes stop_codon:yes gene_type:complete